MIGMVDSNSTIVLGEYFVVVALICIQYLLLFII